MAGGPDLECGPDAFDPPDPVSKRESSGTSRATSFTTRTGRQAEPQNVYRSFTGVAESAGLRVVRLHDARHGTATLLTAAGVAPRVVMEILGHSQISITMDVCTHVVQDTQREAISHMDRLLKRRPVAGDRPRRCQKWMSKAPDHDRSGAFSLVPPAGFEPATPALGERCSIP